MRIKPLKSVHRELWPTGYADNLERVFRSGEFLVQEFAERDDAKRLSVCRVKRRGATWKGDISWDELQQIKRALGHGDRCAIEIYPEDKNIVNIANMRHIFVLKERHQLAWINNGTDR